MLMLALSLFPSPYVFPHSRCSPHQSPFHHSQCYTFSREEQGKRKKFSLSKIPISCRSLLSICSYCSLLPTTRHQHNSFEMMSMFILSVIMAAVICITLAKNMDMVSKSGYSGCPYTVKPIDKNNSKYKCPGGNEEIEPYILFGFLGSFQPAYSGVGMIIAGAIPMAVEKVNR